MSNNKIKSLVTSRLQSNSWNELNQLRLIGCAQNNTIRYGRIILLHILIEFWSFSQVFLDFILIISFFFKISWNFDHFLTFSLWFIQFSQVSWNFDHFLEVFDDFLHFSRIWAIFWVIPALIWVFFSGNLSYFLLHVLNVYRTLISETHSVAIGVDRHFGGECHEYSIFGALPWPKSLDITATFRQRIGESWPQCDGHC